MGVDRGYASNGLNQYTASGAVTPTYDARGNLTSAGSDTYDYSSENMLVSATGGVSLSYDPLLRLHQTVGAATTRMAHDGLDLIAEYDGSDALQRRYVHGPGTDEPIVWYEGSGTNDRRWLHADERGSIVAVTDSSGAAIAVNSYDEYGIPGSGNAGRFQYTGQQWLGELGMYHYKARIYSPTLGRFLQTDPIGYGDGMNMYAYVANNPVNSTDPLGLCTASDQINTCVSVDGVDEIFVTGVRLPQPDLGVISIAVPIDHWEVFQEFAGEGSNQQSSTKACDFAPLNPADRALLGRVLSDPGVLSQILLAWANTLRTGNEWSFWVYSDSSFSLWGGFSSYRPGRLLEGSENTTHPLHGPLYLNRAPGVVVNVHTHSGTYPDATRPSTSDSNYNKVTGTLGIIVTRGGIRAGRECK